MRKRILRIIILIAISIMSTTIVIDMYKIISSEKITKKIEYSLFKEHIANNKFSDVEISEKLNTQMKFFGNSLDNKNLTYITNVPNRDSIFSEVTSILDANNVNYTFTDKEESSFLGGLVMTLLPITIICILIYYMMSKSSGGSSGVFKMFKNKAILIKSDVKFNDIAGNEDTISEVKEIVDFLANPEKYKNIGGKIPKGVLMVGPPGTGKTLLAKAVAGESNVPFFGTSGSEFVEVFAGLGASRVRDMFKEARANAPCIIFIDEIDGIGKKRGGANMGGNDEREQTLNQLLIEMDGIIESGLPIIIMAATNRDELLDEALTRPGRFDRIVNVGLPDILSREKILGIHSRQIKTVENFDFKSIAKITVGFSGADLANLCNEAALIAGRKGSEAIEKIDFEEAIDKILMGVKQQGIQMEEKEKSLTAYHEAGHAIIGYLKHKELLHDPVHKVSIIPRGRSLGVTMYQPEKDRVSLNKAEIKAQITSLYGGRIAEEIMLGEDFITTGASNDLDRATNYAYNYVTKWGLSSLGPIYYATHQSHIDGRERLISTETQNNIEKEITELLLNCYNEGVAIIKENMDKLQLMHDALMEFETISAEDVVSIMRSNLIVKEEETLIEDNSSPEVATENDDKSLT